VSRSRNRRSDAEVAAVIATVAIPSLHWDEALLRIALAALLGGAIGLEREFREHEAGLRTHMLVAVGSALFTITSAYGFRDFLVNGGSVVRADPTRIAAQIVTGIGFLGAGTIIRQGLAVRGLTTAATLWVVAAIGLSCGSGYYSAAAIATAVAVFLLGPMRFVARRFLDRPHEHRLAVQLASGVRAAFVVEQLERLGVHIQSFEVADDDTAVDFLLELPRGIAPGAVVRMLVQHESVRSAAWRS
jgi:putative Mg2+ transporter-C (MgtC) family protein